MPLTRPKAHQLSGQSAKTAVRAVSTTNITLSGGTPATVDGVSLSLEDRVLVTGQSSSAENGIYRVTTVGSGSNGTWVRGRDSNQNDKVVAGMTTMVAEGTTYGDTLWKLITDGTITLGTTSLTFEQHSTVVSNQPSFRNLIINGDMRIAQRGTSAVSGSPNFPVDRWRIVSNQSSKFTAQQSSDVPTGQGFKNSIVFTSSSAYTEASGDYFLVQHRFEGNNIEHLHYGNASAKTVTVSFWVKSSLTGTFAGALRDGGSYTTSYIFEYTISSANTWEYKTVTISGPTSGTWLTGTSVGAELGFALGGGSGFNGTASAWQSTNDFITSSANRLVNTNGATLYITGVQLEVGSQATPFEHRPYDVELARCQRYYYEPVNGINHEINVGWYYNSNWMSSVIDMPVPMRVKPTMSITTGTNYYTIYRAGTSNGLSTLVLENSNANHTCLSVYNNTDASGTAGQAGILRGTNASSKIQLSAEL